MVQCDTQDEVQGALRLIYPTSMLVGAQLWAHLVVVVTSGVLALAIICAVKGVNNASVSHPTQTLALICARLYYNGLTGSLTKPSAKHSKATASAL
jgi:hypothetical protein